jgi:hypothetical protein
VSGRKSHYLREGDILAACSEDTKSAKLACRGRKGNGCWWQTGLFHADDSAAGEQIRMRISSMMMLRARWVTTVGAAPRPAGQQLRRVGLMNSIDIIVKFSWVWYATCKPVCILHLIRSDNQSIITASALRWPLYYYLQVCTSQNFLRSTHSVSLRPRPCVAIRCRHIPTALPGNGDIMSPSLRLRCSTGQGCMRIQTGSHRRVTLARTIPSRLIQWSATCSWPGEWSITVVIVVMNIAAGRECRCGNTQINLY